jgi:hypothetical protein
MFLLVSTTAFAEDKELVSDYNSLLLSLTQKEIDGYPVAPIFPLMEKVYVGIEQGRFEEARQMLDIVRAQLSYVEKNHRSETNLMKELLFARVIQGILKYFLLLVLLGLLSSALPVFKNSITEVFPVRTNFLSLCLFTVSALFGTSFLWGGNLQEQAYFLDLGALLPLVASLSAGPLLGGLVALTVAGRSRSEPANGPRNPSTSTS